MTTLDVDVADVETAARAARSPPDTKAAIAYLIASGATAITIIVGVPRRDQDRRAGCGRPLVAGARGAEAAEGLSVHLNAPDHQQDPADLRQQHQPQHREVITGGPKHASAHPCNDSDSRLGRRVGGLLSKPRANASAAKWRVPGKFRLVASRQEDCISAS